MADYLKPASYSSAANYRLAKKYSYQTDPRSKQPQTTVKDPYFHNPETKNNNHIQTRVISCSVKRTPESFSHYYVSKITSQKEHQNSSVIKHVASSFKVLKQFSQIRNVLPPQPLHMPQHERHRNQKTLIFDLDQTLIHATKLQKQICDFRVQMIFPSGQLITASVNLRPYAMDMLQNLSKYFQIIVFTASHQFYADPILDAIDPQGRLFSYRLYREHCVQLRKDVFAKDLRVIPRAESQIVLVDNSAVSYVFQPDNGVPITSYYCEEDEQLRGLQSYLLRLLYLVDVKNMNARTFKLSKYKDYESVEQAISELYSID